MSLIFEYLNSKRFVVIKIHFRNKCSKELIQNVYLLLIAFPKYLVIIMVVNIDSDYVLPYKGDRISCLQ